jgi:pimeloyl-ACP methyl ester carboxylesterase
MPLLPRNGVELYYETHGNGPALLLTHGFAATSEMWREQVAPLSRRHTLVLWDMRGHGRTVAPADDAFYSEAETVADMAAILDAVGVKRAIVGGLSLGGYMSLAFYGAHPERVTALLVIDTGPGFRKDEARAQWNERARERAAALEREGLGQLQSRSKEMAMSRHGSAEALARAARGMLTQRDDRVIRGLPDIAVPALVIAGAQDAPFLAATDYMAQKIPNATKVIIEGAGHAANIDQPAAFNDALERFLATLA